MSFKDYLIVSDIDGTLLNAPNPIPLRNLQALREFTNHGGRFALATGRSVDSAGQYVCQLPVNVPCILFNGAGIYDYTKQRLLVAQYLPDHFREYVRVILERFPSIGAQLHDPETMYIVSDPYYVKKYLVVENIEFVQMELEALSQKFLKLVLVMDPEMVEDVDKFVHMQHWEDVSFCRSGPYYVEMLPLGTNKGTALRQLAQLLNHPISQVVAIGDFYNDLQMLQAAGISATVAEAPEDIKQLCNVVTGSFENGALADLITYLKQRG